MRTPICEVCLGSTILCKACKEKLDKGIISKADVEISRLIYQTSVKAKSLKDVTIKKVVATSNMVVVVCKRGDAAKIIGKSGVIVKKLSKVLDKMVRIAEESKDYKNFLQSLIYPVPLLGINISYTHEGETLKLRIPKRASMSIPSKDFNQIVKEFFKQDVELINE